MKDLGDYLSLMNMTKDDDAVCHLFYMRVADGLSGSILNLINIICGVVIFISNVLLINGLCKSPRRNSYTRNEKLVLLLSAADITVALIRVPLQTVLLKTISHIRCLTISIMGFWVLLPLTFAGSIIVVISIERFIAVFNDKKCCGIYFKFIYVIPIISFQFLVSSGLSVWYASIINQRATLYQQSHFFFSIATYTITNLLSVVVINTSLLIGTKKRMRNKEIQVLKRDAVERRLSNTMMLISVSHIVSYLPSVVANFYLATVLNSGKFQSVGNATQIMFWTIILSEYNSVSNAVIYVTRNRRISQMYISYICSLKTFLHIRKTESLNGSYVDFNL